MIVAREPWADVFVITGEWNEVQGGYPYMAMRRQGFSPDRSAGFSSFDSWVVLSFHEALCRIGYQTNMMDRSNSTKVTC